MDFLGCMVVVCSSFAFGGAGAGGGRENRSSNANARNHGRAPKEQ